MTPSYKRMDSSNVNLRYGGGLFFAGFFVLYVGYAVFQSHNSPKMGTLPSEVLLKNVKLHSENNVNNLQHSPKWNVDQGSLLQSEDGILSKRTLKETKTDGRPIMSMRMKSGVVGINAIVGSSERNVMFAPGSDPSEKATTLTGTVLNQGVEPSSYTKEIKPLSKPKDAAIGINSISESTNPQNEVNNVTKYSQFLDPRVSVSESETLRENRKYTPMQTFVEDASARRETYSLDRPVAHISGLVQATPTSEPLPLQVGNTSIRCDKLMNGDKEEIDRAYRVQNESKYCTYLQPFSLIRMATDCTKFRTMMGYLDRPTSEEEGEFPLAYGIRLHKNPGQAERLLRAIYQPQNLYCIYIDLKSSLLVHQAMKQVASCFDNVFIASKLDFFTYSTYSPVQADLQCMTDVLNTSVPWKYFLNVAGQEFPLKTNLELVKIHKALNGTNEIENYPLRDLYRHRVNRVHRVVNGYMEPTWTRKKPFTYNNRNITLQKGSSYNSFSRKFVEWILTSDFAQKLFEWSRDTNSPDELVWATLNHQPEAPGGYPVMTTQIAKTALAREVIWKWSPAYCHSGRFVHGICILSAGDLNWLSRRWEFFANKFDLDVDHIGMDCLAESLRRRTQHPDPDHSIPWERINHLPHFIYSRHKHNGEPLPDHIKSIIEP